MFFDFKREEIKSRDLAEIESDDIIRRAYNCLDELKEIVDVSNSDQARLIRTYYQLIRNIRKSTSIEELKSKVEGIEENVLCNGNNDKLDVFQDNLGKLRILDGEISNDYGIIIIIIIIIIISLRHLCNYL